MKTGRPRKAPHERLIPVCVNVPAPVVDAVHRLALSRRCSSSEVLRSIIADHFRNEKAQIGK